MDLHQSKFSLIELRDYGLGNGALPNNQCKWPRKLEELVPEYLAKLPTDPFNGEPLLVGTILGGLVIYSVGPDLQDNNGLIDNSYSLSVKEGTDIGFRLWEVPMRRQPAK